MVKQRNKTTEDKTPEEKRSQPRKKRPKGFRQTGESRRKRFVGDLDVNRINNPYLLSCMCALNFDYRLDIKFHQLFGNKNFAKLLIGEQAYYSHIRKRKCKTKGKKKRIIIPTMSRKQYKQYLRKQGKDILSGSEDEMQKSDSDSDDAAEAPPTKDDDNQPREEDDRDDDGSDEAQNNDQFDDSDNLGEESDSEPQPSSSQNRKSNSGRKGSKRGRVKTKRKSSRRKKHSSDSDSNVTEASEMPQEEQEHPTSPIHSPLISKEQKRQQQFIEKEKKLTQRLKKKGLSRTQISAAKRKLKMVKNEDKTVFKKKKTQNVKGAGRYGYTQYYKPQLDLNFIVNDKLEDGSYRYPALRNFIMMSFKWTKDKQFPIDPTAPIKGTNNFLKKNLTTIKQSVGRFGLEIQLLSYQHMERHFKALEKAKPLVANFLKLERKGKLTVRQTEGDSLQKIHDDFPDAKLLNFTRAEIKECVVGVCGQFYQQMIQPLLEHCIIYSHLFSKAVSKVKTVELDKISGTYALNHEEEIVEVTNQGFLKLANLQSSAFDIRKLKAQIADKFKRDQRLNKEEEEAEVNNEEEEPQSSQDQEFVTKTPGGRPGSGSNGRIIPIDLCHDAFYRMSKATHFSKPREQRLHALVSLESSGPYSEEKMDDNLRVDCKHQLLSPSSRQDNWRSLEVVAGQTLDSFIFTDTTGRYNDEFAEMLNTMNYVTVNADGHFQQAFAGRTGRRFHVAQGLGKFFNFIFEIQSRAFGDIVPCSPNFAETKNSTVVLGRDDVTSTVPFFYLQGKCDCPSGLCPMTWLAVVPHQPSSTHPKIIFSRFPKSDQESYVIHTAEEVVERREMLKQRYGQDWVNTETHELIDIAYKLVNDHLKDVGERNLKLTKEELPLKRRLSPGPSPTWDLDMKLFKIFSSKLKIEEVVVTPSLYQDGGQLIERIKAKGSSPRITSTNPIIKSLKMNYKVAAKGMQFEEFLKLKEVDIVHGDSGESASEDNLTASAPIDLEPVDSEEYIDRMLSGFAQSRQSKPKPSKRKLSFGTDDDKSKTPKKKTKLTDETIKPAKETVAVPESVIGKPSFVRTQKARKTMKKPSQIAKERNDEELRRATAKQATSLDQNSSIPESVERVTGDVPVFVSCATESTAENVDRATDTPASGSQSEVIEVEKDAFPPQRVSTEPLIDQSSVNDDADEIRLMTVRSENNQADKNQDLEENIGVENDELDPATPSPSEQSDQTGPITEDFGTQAFQTKLFATDLEEFENDFMDCKHTIGKTDKRYLDNSAPRSRVKENGDDRIWEAITHDGKDVDFEFKEIRPENIEKMATDDSHLKQFFKEIIRDAADDPQKCPAGLLSGLKSYWDYNPVHQETVCLMNDADRVDEYKSIVSDLLVTQLDQVSFDLADVSQLISYLTKCYNHDSQQSPPSTLDPLAVDSHFVDNAIEQIKTLSEDIGEGSAHVCIQQTHNSWDHRAVTSARKDISLTACKKRYNGTCSANCAVPPEYTNENCNKFNKNGQVPKLPAPKWFSLSEFTDPTICVVVIHVPATGRFKDFVKQFVDKDGICLQMVSPCQANDVLKCPEWTPERYWNSHTAVEDIEAATHFQIGVEVELSASCRLLGIRHRFCNVLNLYRCLLDESAELPSALFDLFVAKIGEEFRQSFQGFNSINAMVLKGCRVSQSVDYELPVIQPMRKKNGQYYIITTDPETDLKVDRCRGFMILDFDDRSPKIPDEAIVFCQTIAKCSGKGSGVFITKRCCQQVTKKQTNSTGVLSLAMMVAIAVGRNPRLTEILPASDGVFRQLRLRFCRLLETGDEYKLMDSEPYLFRRKNNLYGESQMNVTDDNGGSMNQTYFVASICIPSCRIANFLNGDQTITCCRCFKQYHSNCVSVDSNCITTSQTKEQEQLLKESRLKHYSLFSNTSGLIPRPQLCEPVDKGDCLFVCDFCSLSSFRPVDSDASIGRFMERIQSIKEWVDPSLFTIKDICDFLRDVFKAGTSSNPRFLNVLLQELLQNGCRGDNKINILNFCDTECLFNMDGKIKLHNSEMRKLYLVFVQKLHTEINTLRRDTLVLPLYVNNQYMFAWISKTEQVLSVSVHNPLFAHNKDESEEQLAGNVCVAICGALEVIAYSGGESASLKIKPLVPFSTTSCDSKSVTGAAVLVHLMYAIIGEENPFCGDEHLKRWTMEIFKDFICDNLYPIQPKPKRRELKVYSIKDEDHADFKNWKPNIIAQIQKFDQ